MPRFIQVSLTNPIGTWVQKTNALQGYVGDLDDLNPNILTHIPNADSSVVSVLNFLDSSVSQMQDSVNMQYMKLDSGDFGLIRVDSSIASRHLQNLTTTLILDSASVVLKTLFTPGR